MKNNFIHYLHLFLAYTLRIPNEIKEKLPTISKNEGVAKSIFLCLWYVGLKTKLKKMPKDQIHLIIRNYELHKEFDLLCTQYLKKHDSHNVSQLKMLLMPYDKKNLKSATLKFQKEISNAITQRTSKPIKHDKFSHSEALEALTQLKEIFLKESLSLFMISGTFLGAVREKNFISSDYDIDLGFWESEVEISKLVSIIKKYKNFEVKKIDPDGYIIVLKYKSVFIDLFKHYEEDGLIWHATQNHKWWNKKFELSMYEVSGVSFPGPKDFECYLSENYTDWKTKSLFYHFSFDTPNRHYHQSTSSLIYLKSIALRGLNGEQGRYETQMALLELEKNFGIDINVKN